MVVIATVPNRSRATAFLPFLTSHGHVFDLKEWPLFELPLMDSNHRPTA
ncbi:hypothetical protein SynA1524_02076 [Synechococcus sp. A15-24]|nr:hypothetical protein SynA1524_02076 [Synechococcus sp. A15-24]